MKKIRGGFTLIEMALSLAFIGILSVMMVVLIQNTTTSYQRGLILNQLNTIGMDLIDDIRSSIQGSNTDSLYKLCERKYGSGAGSSACVNDNGNSFVSVTKYATVKIGGNSIGSLPVYGAFCTGTYTYIWNSGYFEEGQFAEQREVVGTNPVILTDGSGNTVASDFRLLKIYDRERSVCVNANANQNGGAYVATPDNTRIPTQFKIDSYTGNLQDKNAEGKMELLKKNATGDLVLYDFYMTRPAFSQTRQNLFFAGSFILGTRRGGINIKASGNSCKAPGEDYSDLEYCAINKFNFAVQAGGS